MYRGERFNSWSHLAGAVFALTALVLLVTVASLRGDAWKVTSVSIYGASLLLLFLVSTLYHSARGRAKDILRKLDYCAIYLLIAGSYTPFTLVTIRGSWGWAMFGAVWGLAVVGIVQELVLARGARISSLLIYLLMGWCGLIAAGPLAAALPGAGFAWLAAGGVIYTVGIVFYAIDAHVRHAHGVWHLFVLGGAGAHFVAVLRYVL